MKGAYHQYIRTKGKNSKFTDAVEDATALHAEACELRLARIMNGKEPSHQNGKTLVKQ